MRRPRDAYWEAEVAMVPQPVFAFAPLLAEHAVTVVMGVAIAATCGIRAFLPLLVVNVLALTGRIELSDAFSFMGTWHATVLFGTATLAELAGDKFPGVDHLLDAFGTVIRPAAATVAAATMFGELEPLTACAFGLIGGGVTAGAVHAVKSNVRLATSSITAGFGNAVVSLGEDVLAFGSLVLAILAPLVLSVAALCLLCAGVWIGNARRDRALVTATV